MIRREQCHATGAFASKHAGILQRLTDRVNKRRIPMLPWRDQRATMTTMSPLCRGSSALKGCHKKVLLLGGLGIASIIAPRYVWFRRRDFSDEWQLRTLAFRDHTSMSIAHSKRGHARLVIVAHGLLRAMNDRGLVRLAEALGQRFDVLAFDFPGHGHSAGVTDLSYASAATYLSRVIDYARTLGYTRIASVGYSMGAAASILAAARGAPLNAIVSVSGPAGPRPNQATGGRWATWPWRSWARLMGTRVAQEVHPESWPIEYVGEVSPIPLLIVHHGLDTLVRREDSESLFALARPPKDYLYVPGALHASPMASSAQVIAWLNKAMPSHDPADEAPSE